MAITGEFLLFSPSPMSGKHDRAIYTVAEGQHGYFTVGQAAEVGVPADRVRDMHRRNVAERVSRGVYRLTQFPLSSRGPYMEAVLWPAAKGAADIGFLSHESALAFYDLSDVNPAKLHITVAPTRRIRRTPPAHIIIHHAPLAKADITVQDGVPVTTAARAIRDCAMTNLGPALVRQAIQDARSAGWLTADSAAALTAELSALGKL